MAGAPTLLLRLLPLLLLLLPSGLRDYLSPSPAAIINRRPEDATTRTAPGAATELALHPIVLMPGISCSELEARLTDAYRPSLPRCGAMKGKGWFGLWANSTDLAAHDYVPCFVEQMSLAYDPAAGDYRNLPGVETRVRNFGSSRGFQRNPKHSDWCLEIFRRALEEIGYRDGETLFGAPYDLRHAPPPPVPGQPSEVFSRYFRRLTRLIEDATRRNRGRKAILFGHSFGGMVALDFVRSTPTAWRREHIKHLVLAAPLPAAAGFVMPLQNFASGSSILYFPGTAAMAMTLRPMWRSFESAILSFPSPAVFGRRPVVVTKERNYSAHDMEEFLAAVGAGAAVEPFRRRVVPRMRYESQQQAAAPMVPTTCINGVGNETPEQFVYWDGDFDKAPVAVNGDGDGVINLVSMLELDEQMRRQPEQKKMFKSIKLHGASHGALVTEEWSLKRVMQEILEANRAY